MDEETTNPTPVTVEPSFSLRDMDEDTIAILVEDKIATGG